MMDPRNIKIATITIGAYEPPLIVDLTHEYYFSENITERELVEEIKSLIGFYERVVLPTGGPPHLRLDKIKERVYND